MIEQPEAPQPTIPMININMTPNSLVISQVVAALNEDAMQQIVMKWLETHPALLDEIVKQAVAAKRGELALIKHVTATRND
jgi:hypothetical protein